MRKTLSNSVNFFHSVPCGAKNELKIVYK